MSPRSSVRSIALCILVCAIAGCSRDLPTKPASQARDVSSSTPAPAGPLGGKAPAHPTPAAPMGPHTVYVPAGSVDAIGAALAQAGAGGRVVLRSGTHQENQPVVVSNTLVIEGEPGAIVESSAQQFPPAPAMVPTLWVQAPRTVVRGIGFHSSTGGGIAVLLDNASQSSVTNCVMRNMQFGIIVQYSDKVRLTENRIDINTGWQTGVVGDAEGIVVMNGRNAQVVGNTVTNAAFGIWANDGRGVCRGNHTDLCYEGIILCKVPEGGYVFPSGPAGARYPCNGWEVEGNEASQCLENGLLAIDGAFENTIVENDFHDNAVNDCELSGDSTRFGFLTPGSHDNRFEAGQYHNLRVKNCGLHNQVEGGSPVDLTAHPCY